MSRQSRLTAKIAKSAKPSVSLRPLRTLRSYVLWAAAAYRQAVDAQPTFRLARFNLGRMLIALSRPGDAIVELEKLTEPRDADAPRYLFALATAHVRAGHREEGIKWATDAKQLAATHGQAELAAAIDRELARLR